MYASKSQRRTFEIRVVCSPSEKKYIAIRARQAGLSISEFIREMGMKDSPEKKKTLPPEVMAFIGKLSGIIGALEIIARRRLDNDDLDALERAELILVVKELKLLIGKIKSYLI